jgi:hypothetical protein
VQTCIPKLAWAQGGIQEGINSLQNIAPFLAVWNSGLILSRIEANQ